MVFHDDIEAVLRRELAQLSQTIGGALHLLVVGTGGTRIDPNAMAPQRLACFHPFEVILDRLLAFRRVGITEITFAVAHDQHIDDPFSVGDFF